jgi:Uma2 family endonuclease
MGNSLLEGEVTMATASFTPGVADGDTLYEVVNGEIVELPPMGVLETLIASLICQHLQWYMAEARRGWVVQEMLFDFTRVLNKKRRPDLAFVSYDRWPEDKPVGSDDAWDVVPNLAVEVVSPTNTAGEVMDKLEDYFQAGIDRVWVVYPLQRIIYVYSSPSDVSVVDEHGDLTEPDLLPGFRLSMRTLFGISPTRK